MNIVKVSLEMFLRRLLFALPVFLAGIAIQIPIGALFFSAANLTTYIVSFTRRKSLDYLIFGTKITEGGLIGSTYLMLFSGGAGVSISMVIGGVLCRYVGPRLTTFIGCLISAFSVIATTGTVYISSFVVMVSYGFLFAFGYGMVYISILYVGMRWLPAWRGLAVGIIVAGPALGGFVIPLQDHLLNPENLRAYCVGLACYYTEEEILDKVPFIFLWLGLVYLGIQLLAVPFIVEPPEDWEDFEQLSSICKMWFLIRPRCPANCCKEKETHLMHHSADHETDEHQSLYGSSGDTAGSRQANQNGPSVAVGKSTYSKFMPIRVSPKQLLKRRNFYSLLIAFVLSGQCVSFWISSEKVLMEANKLLPNDSIGIGIASVLCNFIGRPLWGLFVDLTSIRTGLVFLLALMSLAVLTVGALVNTGKWVLFVYDPLIHFCLGGTFTVFPTAIARWYGLEYTTINYGILFSGKFFSVLISCIILPLLYTYVHFSGQAVLSGGLCAVGLVIIALTKERKYVIFSQTK